MASRKNNPYDLPVGAMNRRITLLSPAQTQDAAGGPDEDVPGAELWAAIDSTYGQNVFQGQYVSEATHTVTIWYRDGVTPSMRVRYGTRVFNILFIGNPREANVRLVLYCQEVM